MINCRYLDEILVDQDGNDTPFGSWGILTVVLLHEMVLMDSTNSYAGP